MKIPDQNEFIYKMYNFIPENQHTRNIWINPVYVQTVAI